MPRGPGKYDSLATHALAESNALAVLVLVLGGKDGSGFSVQIRSEAAKHLDLSPLAIGQLLRDMAESIERDHKADPCMRD